MYWIVCIGPFKKCVTLKMPDEIYEIYPLAIKLVKMVISALVFFSVTPLEESKEYNMNAKLDFAYAKKHPNRNFICFFKDLIFKQYLIFTCLS